MILILISQISTMTKMMIMLAPARMIMMMAGMMTMITKIMITMTMTMITMIMTTTTMTMITMIKMMIVCGSHPHYPHSLVSPSVRALDRTLAEVK